MDLEVFERNVILERATEINQERQRAYEEAKRKKK